MVDLVGGSKVEENEKVEVTSLRRRRPLVTLRRVVSVLKRLKN